MKVLISAFACHPERGSEDAVGWGWIRAAARNHEVHVITAAFQREPIESRLRRDPHAAGGATFHYVTPRWFHYRPEGRWLRIENGSLKPLMNLAYTQWLRDAGRLARSLDAEHAYDLVHLVTYVGYRFPGTYDRMRPPLVWGPIGGLENTRWRLLPALGAFGAAYYGVRNVINAVQARVQPSVRRALRRAGPGVIAATSGIQRALQALYRIPSTVIAEVGCPEVGEARASHRADGEPLRLVWSGLHLPGKALPLVLRALARLPATDDIELHVLGAGPCTTAWRAEAADLGVAARVRWLGHVPRADALDVMRHAHVLVISSLKDLTSTVLVEALALGLPVIAPDHCGFAGVLTPACGIKVPAESVAQLTAGLATAISTLAADEPRRRRLAADALARAREFTWEAKAAQIDRVYRRCVAVGAA